MAFGGKNKGGLTAEINVTPLVDVVLVLLIIFMVVTPMLTRGRNVQLPVASMTDSEQEVKDSVVVTITSDRTLWVENQRVKPEHLTQQIKLELGQRPNRDVLIKADSAVTVKDLRPLLTKLKQEKITEIGFAVLGEKKAAR
jgi:biopolymer transport protein ExbD/biopolymer transport protein TolR